MMTSLTSSIFREYDIRGIIGQNLNDDIAELVGKAFATVVHNRGGKKIGLCYDGRHSSPTLAQAFIKGVIATGLTIENYGLAPTPLTYFALNHRDLDAGVIITGSHNPPDYNGIKMTFRDRPVSGDEIRALYDRIMVKDFITGAGQTQDIDIKPDYISRITSDYNAQGHAPLNIVWDAGNGATGAVLKNITKKIPGTHIRLYDDVDGDFPNHHPDPSVGDNLTDLIKTVKKNNYDLGIAFDGDGDRIGAVDRMGNIIWGDQLLALYARDTLTRHPNAPIVLDVKCSQTIHDMISHYGGRPVWGAVGHSLAKKKMKEVNAPLGGELSGHIYIKDGWTGHDDGIYCAIRLINLIHKFGDLSKLRQEFPQTYNTPEIRFEVGDEKKFTAIETIVENIKNSDGFDVLDIDGARVTTTDGWFLIRASNTQPMLTIRAESNSEDGLTHVIADLKAQLEKAGITPPDELG